MRVLKYLGKLGPSVRAADVNDWRTGETHEIQNDQIAKSLMQSGHFEDVTPIYAAVKPAAAKSEKVFESKPEPKPIE